MVRLLLPGRQVRQTRECPTRVAEQGMSSCQLYNASTDSLRTVQQTATAPHRHFYNCPLQARPCIVPCLAFLNLQSKRDAFPLPSPSLSNERHHGPHPKHHRAGQGEAPALLILHPSFALFQRHKWEQQGRDADKGRESL